METDGLSQDQQSAITLSWPSSYAMTMYYLITVRVPMQGALQPFLSFFVGQGSTQVLVPPLLIKSFQTLLQNINH